MATLGVASLRTQLDLSGLRAGFNQADALGRQSLAKISGDFTRIGRNMTLAVTTPIVGMGTAIVTTAANFESSMNRVRALSGATGADFDRLKGQAQELGSTTVYSASQAADGMSFLAMAGLEVDQIYGAMPSTLQLAAAAQLELADAADIVTNIMTGFGTPVDELENSVDVLAAAFISANTDLRQLGDGMSFVGPVASGLGVTFEETTAAIGLLSNAGIQGSRAGTSLSRILSILSTDGEKLGVSIFDATGRMRPFADILEDIEDQGMSSAEVMDFFGQRGGPGMLALLSQGSGALRDYTADLTDVGGTAERVANTQLEGLRGKWVELTSATEGLLISWGEAGLLGLAERVIVKLTDLVKWVDSWDDSTKNVVGTVAGLAAAIGPLLLGLGGLVRLLPVIATGFAVLSGPAGWITLAAVAVGSLAVALSGRRDSLDSTAERAQQAMADLDTQAARTESALDQLTEATDEDGLRGAAEAMASTLEGEAKDSFVSLAEQAIASGGDITEIGDTLLELFARLREESLNTRVAAARDLRETAQAQFRQAQAQHEQAVASFEFRQEQADRLASVNAERATQLEAREAELLNQLAEQRARLVEARGTAYEGMYQSAVDATQTQLDGVRSQMEELGAAQEQLSTNLNESAENLRFAAENLGIAHEHLNAELAAQYQNDLFLAGQADSPFADRLRGRTPTVTGGHGGTPTDDLDDAAQNVVTRVNEAKDAVGEVETATVRTAETAQDMFDAIAAGGSELDQRVAQLGGTTELTLAGLEQKAELFRAAIGRAFELEDLTAAEFAYLERRLGELTTEAENLQLMLAGHEAQLAYEQSGSPLVTERAAARMEARAELEAAEAAAASLANQSRQNIEDQRREDENYAAYRAAMNERAMREQQELQQEFEQTGAATRIAAAEQQAARDDLNDYTLTLAELSRVSREADAAERARLNALEQAREEARQARLASAFDITRGAPAAGPTGSEMGAIISTLNTGLADLDLRVNLFGETTQTARERVNLLETATLEAARVHGENSVEAEHFRERLSDARDTLQFFTVSLIDARDTLARFSALQAGDTSSIGSLANQGIVMSGPDGLTADDAQQIGEHFGGTVEDSGVELANTIIGAGQSFAQIVQSAQSGSPGGVMSGIGGLAGGIMTAVGGAMGPWGAVVSAGMGLLGSLFDMAGSGSRDREAAQERERSLARSTPAISITANVSQTNNLNGGIMDARTQVELDNRTRSIVAEVLDQIGIQQYLNPGGAAS